MVRSTLVALMLVCGIAQAEDRYKLTVNDYKLTYRDGTEFTGGGGTAEGEGKAGVKAAEKRGKSLLEKRDSGYFNGVNTIGRPGYGYTPVWAYDHYPQRVIVVTRPYYYPPPTYIWAPAR